MTKYNALGIGLIFLGHFLWCMNLYDNKLSKRLTGVLYASITVLATLLCVYLGFWYNADINRLATLLFFIAFIVVSASFFLLSGGYFFKRLFLVFTYYIFFCIIHNLSYLIASCLVSPTKDVYFLVGIGIRTFLHLGALLLYVYWMKKRMLQIHVYDKKQWIPLCVVSIVFFCLHSIWMAVATNVWNYHFYDTVIFFLLLLMTIGLYVVMIYTINYMNACAENDQVKLHSNFLLEQLKNYEKAEEKNRRFRHDVRHHLLHMSNLIHTGDFKAALDYIDAYDKTVLSLSQERYCKNTVINNIISSYAAKFREKNIAFSVKCPIGEDLKMKDIDIVALLGNLLENALHASEKSALENKMTALYLSKNRNQFLVVCENTCSEPLELVNGIPKKKGIGILSILNVCEIYRGQACYRVENGLCSVCIVFPLQ